MPTSSASPLGWPRRYATCCANTTMFARLIPLPGERLWSTSGPTIIILESSEEPIARGVAADLTDSLADRVTYERGSKELLIYSISQERALESCRPAETSASTFDGQVEFAGIRLQPTDGRGLIVVNCWHVRQRPADLPSQVSIFNHLYRW